MAFDALDFSRGIDAFLTGMAATSVHALCRGFDEAGIKLNQGIGISADLLDARSLFLTANTNTVYVTLCIDLKDGPMVVRVPPRVLGPVDDADFRWVTDVGLTGPDKGEGGDYLFVPPGYQGALPEQGYHIARPRTNRLLMFYRAFVEKGDIPAAVAGVKANAAIFPLSQAANPPATGVVDISGVRFNTISANDFSFYEELNDVVQNEPADWVDPDTVGLYAAIGIRKGQPLAPDARMREILTDSVAVANAIARSNLFASRDPKTRIYSDRQWFTPFVGGSYLFLDGAERLLDARTMFFYYATGITPARTDPRRAVLVLHGLRQPDAIVPSDRSEAGWIGQHAPGRAHEPGWRGHRLVRTRGTSGPGAELGPDHAGQGLQRRASSLRSLGALVRQELATRRDRAPAVTASNR